jgi:hypothetical protein
MRSRRIEIVCWAVCAFVAWNVTFDREVAVAGGEFARQQILRYGQGLAVQSIGDAFTPHVRGAALVATGWAALVAAAGAAVIALGTRRSRALPDAP